MWLMNKNLTRSREWYAAHLDNILIYSKTWEEHLQHLRQTIECQGKAELNINPKSAIWHIRKPRK